MPIQAHLGEAEPLSQSEKSVTITIDALKSEFGDDLLHSIIMATAN